jgi:hypothetical protein
VPRCDSGDGAVDDLDAGEKAEFVEEAVIDRHVEAAARDGIEKAVESVGGHGKLSGERVGEFRNNRVPGGFADGLVDEIEALQQALLRP